MQLEKLSWNELVAELRVLAEHKPSAEGHEDDPRVVVHELLVHQVELEMQNRELRDAQQRLEASRARYADLYDFAPIGCLSVDADERIQEINLTGAALLGRDRADILGKPFVAVVPVRDKAMVIHDHLRRCIGARCRVDTEVEFFPSGRPPMLLHVTSAPLLDAAGQAVGCRTALTDVTDRRRAEQAEAEAQVKDEFLGTVSHELRTPLTAILGWASILQEREKREGNVDPSMLRRALDVIARNASMQSRLVEDLLDVSRIIAGKLRIEAQPIDTEPLIRAAAESARPVAQQKRITLTVTVAPDAFVYGDALRLGQVLANLLGNALKFTPTGGAIDVEAAPAGRFVRLTVRDTGRGIAAHDLPHVFERFKQVDSSTTRTAGGLGLGLAIVDHIVRAHGGDVVVSSAGLGAGATFTVRLRRAEAAPRTARASGVPRQQEGAREGSLEGLTVLCVDDDADTLEVMSIVLRERGARVSMARSAADALAAVAASTPDVVVSDIGLPSEDGYALMRRIRELPGDARHVPAIALTAYAGAATAKRAGAAGFQGFLAKPVEPDAFVRAVLDAAHPPGAEA